MRFDDRHEAGRVLARLIDRVDPRTLVLALPRGGVPVGFEVARALGLPLDVLLVRKLGVPGHEELAMGALASTGALVLEPEIIDQLGISPNELDRVIEEEQKELARREHLYRGRRPKPEVRGRPVLVVDDGLATGASMKAGVAALRQDQPARITVAVPVAPEEAVDELSQLADEVICPMTPEPFWSVGSWYRDFAPTSDDEVVTLLEGDALGRDGRSNPRG